MCACAQVWGFALGGGGDGSGGGASEREEPHLPGKIMVFGVDPLWVCWSWSWSWRIWVMVDPFERADSAAEIYKIRRGRRMVFALLWRRVRLDKSPQRIPGPGCQVLRL